MAEWTTAYINSLPDSSFLYIAPGGSKDSEGKTTPRSLRYFPYKDASGNVDLPHLRNAAARIPQSNLPQSVKDSVMAKCQRLLKEHSPAQMMASAEPPPRENLIRGLMPADFELRDNADGQLPTLVGHFAVFDDWTEINSFFEGRFLERIQMGAFTKTFAENRGQMRVLFQHGKDPQIGDKVLGPVDVLEEQERGAYYEVPLLDTSYNRDLIPGLERGLYGASFRFKVMKDEFDHKPKTSDWNPEGIPERTITEAKVMEFGPVTFPAYDGATAGLRSLTDEFVAGHLLGRMGEADPDKIRAILEAAAHTLGTEPEPSVATTPPEPEPLAATTPTTANQRFHNEEEWTEWLHWNNLTG